MTSILSIALEFSYLISEEKNIQGPEFGSYLWYWKWTEEWFRNLENERISFYNIMQEYDVTLKELEKKTLCNWWKDNISTQLKLKYCLTNEKLDNL